MYRHAERGDPLIHVRFHLCDVLVADDFRSFAAVRSSVGVTIRSPAGWDISNGTKEMELLWQREPATEAKHRLYARYLDAWWPIMLQRPNVPRVTYLDAFAGPGEYKGGEAGSPVLAIERLLNHAARDRMNVTRERVTILLIEADSKRVTHLNGVLANRFGPLNRLPINVIIHQGRAEDDALDLLGQTGAWDYPILAVLDSWGNVGVPWSTINRIACNTSSEAIVTFGPNWFSRRETQEPEKLDAVFGGRRHWSRSDPAAPPAERWKHWLETYRSAVLRAGFEYSVQFEVRPRTGQPLNLVFGTSHASGIDAFKDAMWKVDTSDGMRFNDPRTSAAKEAASCFAQPTLFDVVDGPNEELLAFAVKAISCGSKTVDDVCDFLLRETAQWRGTHGREAIRRLVNDGVVRRDPSKGPLTGSVTLALSSR